MMTDCGLSLPCSSSVTAAASDAFTISNGGTGSAIAATSAGTALSAKSTDGVGVQGRSATSNGLLAISDSGSAVRAISDSGHAISALSFGSSGVTPPDCSVFADTSTAYGVVGSSAGGVGVLGRSDTDRGVVGMSRTEAGVIGSSGGQGLGSFGVVGTCPPGTGVIGISAGSTGVIGFSQVGAGVSGTVSDSGAGVTGSSASGAGVSGYSQGGLISAGVFGVSDAGFISAGVMGLSNADRGIGVYARGGTGAHGGSSGGSAGVFDGNVQVHGSLTKSGGGFRIDHPLEPGRKYLSHSFVEAPERKNYYDGIAELDSNGRCTVELPEWFEALNHDFRYQLTSIGGPHPDLHIAREISSNRFDIAGGGPGAKVSWQVTGVRKDPWAQANPLVVTEEKDEHERESYIHPELYDRSRDDSILWRGNAEALREFEASRRDLYGPGAEQLGVQLREMARDY